MWYIIAEVFKLYTRYTLMFPTYARLYNFSLHWIGFHCASVYVVQYRKITVSVWVCFNSMKTATSCILNLLEVPPHQISFVVFFGLLTFEGVLWLNNAGTAIRFECVFKFWKHLSSLDYVVCFPWWLRGNTVAVSVHACKHVIVAVHCFCWRDIFFHATNFVVYWPLSPLLHAKPG